MENASHFETDLRDCFYHVFYKLSFFENAMICTNVNHRQINIRFFSALNPSCQTFLPSAEILKHNLDWRIAMKKVMPARGIGAVEDLAVTNQLNQFEQFQAITSMLDVARNAEQFMTIGALTANKSGYMDDYSISFENFVMLPFDPNSSEDYQIYKEIVSDAEIMKTVSVFNCRTPSDIEAKKAYSALTEINKLSLVPLSYKIVSKENEVMGLIMPAILERNSEGKPTVLDFGCLFKKKYRGNAALIVCSALAKKSFELPEIKKLVTSALSDNYNPQAIFLRLGFEYVGQTVKKGNDDHIINVFELTRERFFSGKSREVKIRDIRNYIDSLAESFAGRDFLKPFCVRT